MSQPIATESPPIKKPPTEPKRVSFSKGVGGKWKMEIEGPVKRLDVNHLRRVIGIYFMRAKRDARIAEQRKLKARPTVKEITNGK